MEEIYFLIRFTPFWSIPILLISGEFAYLFWIRKKKKWMMICAGIAFFNFCMTIIYYINGGPEKSVQKMMDLVWYFTR
ncbi:MAG: hypothetical protein ACJAS4_002280 [Bacteriovoracaceae bacterium]|jgi:hypothetical protein